MVDLELGNQQACMASLKKKISELAPVERRQGNQRPSICMVYPELRNIDPAAYEPKLVSIGPIHHGKKELSIFEELKLENLRYILSLHGDDGLNYYVSYVFSCLPRARAEYANKIALSDTKLAEILVVDGIFLVGFYLNVSPIRSSPFLTRVKGGLNLISLDLMLLENQIPFFIVNTFFKKICPLFYETQFSDLPNCVLDRHDIKLPEDKYPKEDEVRHLLHLKHFSMDPNHIPQEYPPRSKRKQITFLVNKSVALFFAPFLGLFYLILFRDWSGLFGTSKKSRDSSPRMTIPSAAELYESGVKFEAMQTSRFYSRASQLKVSFEYGTLEMPKFIVVDSTSERLKNLIAFEQCFMDVYPHFSSYCVFLVHLINTAEDVAILRRSGILESMLGSDSDVANMFNSIGTQVYDETERRPYAKVYDDLTAFCEVPYNRWRTDLVQKYFHSPWTLFSVMAALTLLVSTVTQTVFTIKQGK